MSNLLMDATGDLDFSSGGVRIVTGVDAYAQRLRNAFEFFLGEWFLDTRQGIPYFQVIFEMGTSHAVISQIFKDVILRDKETVTVSDFRLEADRATRSAACYFSARSLDGGLLDFTVTPLVIDLSKVIN